MEVLSPKDLTHVIQMPKELTKCAADQTVRLAALHHNCANCSGVCAHDCLGQIRGHTFAGHDVVVGIPIIIIPRVVFGVHDFKINLRPDLQARTLAASFNHLWAANQDRLVGGFFYDRLGGAQHTVIFALGKDDIAFCGAGGLKNRTHDHR